MNYSILTDTEFFRDLESGSNASIRADYDKFINRLFVSAVKRSARLT